MAETKHVAPVTSGQVKASRHWDIRHLTMTSKTRIAVLLVTTPLVTFALLGGLLGTANARQSTYQHLRVFEDVVSLIMDKYVEEADPDKVMLGAMRGLADGLDPDSAYLRPEEVRQIDRTAAPDEGDTGLELTRQYYLRVIAARDDSPAARAGLMSGDYVRAIDGRSTRDISVIEGVRLLRGPVGTKVSLTVLRGNAAEPHTVDLTREKAAPSVVTARTIAPGIGYLRIASFDATVAEQVRNKVMQISDGGNKKLVIDIRRTAEGPLESGLAVARLFVSSGTLAMREVRGGAREMLDARTGDGSVRLPLAVLINSGTSGAAELLAAALAGNKRAELIGEHTFGRVALQRLVRLPDGSGLWMSWARYLTPEGTSIQDKGVEPAVQVEEPDVEFGSVPSSADPALEKALEILGAGKAKMTVTLDTSTLLAYKPTRSVAHV